MQEETTNRIESNYYRKQQAQEAAKQEQLEQEFEQQKAKYLLEKGEVEQEINALKGDLENYRKGVEEAMLAEYTTFFDKFCTSAEKVVGKVFEEKFHEMKQESDADKEHITQLELQLKNAPQNQADAEGQEGDAAQGEDTKAAEGQYDDAGNYVYADGTFYDKSGFFHDAQGNVYTQDGKLVIAAKKEEVQEKVVDLNDFDSFDFMTDVDQKADVYDVAQNVINNLDEGVSVTNSARREEEPSAEEPEEEIEKEIEEPAPKVEEKPQEDSLETFSLDDAEELEQEKPTEETPEEPEEIEEEQEAEPEEDFEDVEEEAEIPETPRRKAGRPRKIVSEPTPAKKPGRPRKEKPVESPKKKAVGRPRKIQAVETPKKKVGRPKKVTEPKVTRKPVGRPKKVVEQKPAKKSVGRPKKVTEPAKKPVGRPKKTAEPKVTKKPVGRPKKVVVAEPVVTKKGRGRPKKTNTILEIDRRLSEEEAKLAKMRKDLNRELEQAIGTNSTDSVQAKRNKIMQEIDSVIKL